MYIVAAIFNNLPQEILGITWTVVIFMAGRRWERWRSAHHLRKPAPK